MASIISALGDEMINSRPGFPGANSPYVLLHHTLAVVDFWAGAFIAGRQIERDRDSEFAASGTVDELERRTYETIARFRQDLVHYTPAAPSLAEPPAHFRGPDRPLTQQGVVLHVLEEVAQHHGQLEITRDMLFARNEGRPNVLRD